MQAENLMESAAEAHTNRTCLFLIDDEPRFCLPVKQMAESRGIDCWVFHSAIQFLEFTLSCSHAERQAWQPASLGWSGCIVTDMHMPEMSGLQLIHVLHQRRVIVPVIVVSADHQVTQAVNCMRRGAAGYIEKPLDPNALLDQVEEVANDPVDQLRNPSASKEKLRVLTPRERQVLALVCDGKLNKTIADILGISIKTVELHRAKLTAKLGVRSIQDLVRLNLGY